MDAPQRYPLAWPAHRPRTKYRKPGTFNYKTDTSNGWRATKSITIAMAMDRLEREVELLGGRYPLLSSNLELNLKGLPRADRGAPTDPGVCLYFTLKTKPMALACDTFSDVAQNIAALAAHIEAVRKIERYGVATAAETLDAFVALPAPIVTEPPWWEVLGLPRETDTAMVETIYRGLAKVHHPDAGGHPDVMARINRARDRALKELTR